MQNLTLTWQTSGGTAVVAFGAAYAARRVHHRHAVPAAAVLRETGILLVLFALWQLVGHLSVMSTDHALDRADWIHRTELRLGFPDEAAWQRAVEPHRWVVSASNYFYATMHFGVMLALLAWVFARRRGSYRWLRNTVVLTTAACLTVQFVPVAPPRMLPGNGFVDLAAEYGQSVYGGAVAGVVPDQLSAMPSVHVAWAVIVAVAVVRIAATPWRWLVVLHPLATVFVVVVTANHFWADGLVAVALLLVVYLVQHACSGWGQEGKKEETAVADERDRSPVGG